MHVLILVVVEDGLRPNPIQDQIWHIEVLILVVVEDGLRPMQLTILMRGLAKS